MDEWYDGIKNHLMMVEVKCLSRLAVMEKAEELDAHMAQERQLLKDLMEANKKTIVKFDYWFHKDEPEEQLPF